MPRCSRHLIHIVAGTDGILAVFLVTGAGIVVAANFIRVAELLRQEREKKIRDQWVA
jgi:hypothetical protein